MRMPPIETFPPERATPARSGPMKESSSQSDPVDGEASASRDVSMIAAIAHNSPDTTYPRSTIRRPRRPEAAGGRRRLLIGARREALPAGRRAEVEDPEQDRDHKGHDKQRRDGRQ